MSKEVDHLLPGHISSIGVQKNNKERYSLFIDEEFLLGISEQTLLKFNLSKGDKITPFLFRKIQREEGRFSVKAYLLKLLGRRDHARKELFTKAKRKRYPGEVINSVLDELEKKGWINDTAFAEQFASEKYRINKWGPAKIQAHLFKKGINRATAKPSVEEVFKNEDLQDTFLNLVLKRKRRFLKEEDPRKRKKKVLDYLAQKGYRPSSVFKHLDRLMKVLEK